MIKERIVIDVYDIEVQVIIARVDKDSFDKLKSEIMNTDFSEETKTRILNNFVSGSWTGHTSYHMTKGAACIVAYNCDRTWQLAEVLTHEIDHLRRYIMQSHQLKGKEASAYLAGFLGRKILPLVLRMK